MTRPTLYLIRMAAFLGAVLAVAVVLSGPLMTAFDANPVLNSLILLVLAFGIGWNVRQVTRLSPEVTWLETFQHARARLAALATPRLLAPMAAMLAARAAKAREAGHAPSERFTLSPQSMRSLLDSIGSRLDESRELSRYMTGLMIFLGLLGTFWGLLLTVHSVSDVIGSMSVGSGDINVLFEQLKSGLARPLRGMGTAFSSSMLGLAGALVLGFLDLTAGQAQNRFFNELEEWLAGSTRLSSGVLGAEGEGSVPVYVQALLEQTAENMESLQSILARGEDSRNQSSQAVLALTERLATLSDTMRTSQQLMLRIAESQQALAPALARLGERRPQETGGDEIMRAHLRNIELYLQRLITESEQGRVQSTAELRNDIRVLTRTIAALAEEQPR
jgi:biopolymer transport protein ExbB/TolQ